MCSCGEDSSNATDTIGETPRSPCYYMEDPAEQDNCLRSASSCTVSKADVDPLTSPPVRLFWLSGRMSTPSGSMTCPATPPRPQVLRRQSQTRKRIGVASFVTGEGLRVPSRAAIDARLRQPHEPLARECTKMAARMGCCALVTGAGRPDGCGEARWESGAASRVSTKSPGQLNANRTRPWPHARQSLQMLRLARHLGGASLAFGVSRMWRCFSIASCWPATSPHHHR